MSKDKTFYQCNEYLDYWKKELDDEALNKQVLQTLLNQKKQFDKILDVGTGSGVQIRKDIEWGLLRNNGTIIGCDINRDGLYNSMASFEEWAKQNGFQIISLKDPIAVHKFLLKKNDKKYNICLYEESVYNLGTSKSKIQHKFPLITGLSLLEHTDMKKSLGRITKIMEPNGLLYLPVNYDQHSVFGPTAFKNYKEESDLMQLFNWAGIDNQFKGDVKVGNSHCGSLLPQFCREAGLKVLSYGSSDWIIPSGKIKPYSENKEKALKFFINAFYDVLKHASPADKRRFNLTNSQIERWYALRKRQLSLKELYYSCVQKDILCKK